MRALYPPMWDPLQIHLRARGPIFVHPVAQMCGQALTVVKSTQAEPMFPEPLAVVLAELRVPVAIGVPIEVLEVQQRASQSLDASPKSTAESCAPL
jgi:hypothetical protein